MAEIKIFISSVQSEFADERKGSNGADAKTNRVDAKMHRVDEKMHRVTPEMHRVKLTKKQQKAVEFCATPHTSREILAHLKLYYQSRSIKKYVTDLVALGYLRPIYPDSLNAPTQKYILVTQGE